METEERCTRDDIADQGGWQFRRCSRRGTVSEDGKLWCKQHAPSAVKARQEETSRRWNEKFEAEMRPYKERDSLRTQNTKLLAALEDIRRIATTDPTNLPQKMFAGNIAARARAAIAEAQEEQT